MTEQELVNAVLTELQKNKKDVSTATIINALQGGEYVVCYDSEGRLSRISPATLATEVDDDLEDIRVAVRMNLADINDLSNDVKNITEKTVYLTESQYNDLVTSGQVQDDVEYNIYEG